jgi:hypothetical protein
MCERLLQQLLTNRTVLVMMYLYIYLFMKSTIFWDVIPCSLIEVQ